MGRRESGEHGVRFYQGWRGDDQRFPHRKPALHLPNGPFMVLMPAAHRGNHDAGVGEKTTHMVLGGWSVSAKLSARPLNRLAREFLDRVIWYRDKEPTAFLKFDGKRCRLDFNQSLPPSNLQLGTRP